MNKADRTLLELAAKAEGTVRWSDAYRGWRVDVDGIQSRAWSPLTDDGDALRLAVKLRLDICRRHAEQDGVLVWVDHAGDFIEEKHEGDPYAATRRAIVRAAAAIGEQMP